MAFISESFNMVFSEGKLTAILEIVPHYIQLIRVPHGHMLGFEHCFCGQLFTNNSCMMISGVSRWWLWVLWDRNWTLILSRKLAADLLISLYTFVFQVVNEHADVHCPVVEMSTQSKLSCLSWNKYSKNLIASSDYEGIVTIWDATTQQVNLE